MDNKQNDEIIEKTDNTKEVINEETMQDEGAAEGTFSEEKSRIENEEFMSDFAPEPIKIPNYNVEKEQAKRSKQKEKTLKNMDEGKRKRRRIIKKIFLAIRCVLMFVLILAVLTATMANVLVKLNTSKYSLEQTIRASEPEKFVIGKIRKPAELGLKVSSKQATIVDILRDNVLLDVITYEEILRAVEKSSYAEFIAKHAHGVISFLLMGERYNGITGKDVEKLLSENVSNIKLATGVELGESACEQFAKHVDKSSALDEIKPAALAKLPAAKYTKITKVAFSYLTLICLIIVLLLLIIITAVSCGGYLHVILGIACMLAATLTGGAGFLFNPGFVIKSNFIKNVYDAVIAHFNKVSLIMGIIVLVIGAFILCIGHMLSGNDEDELETEE